MIAVVLIEAENEGNIGAVARVMKNFDLDELVLINPKCRITEKTKARAKHANDVLKKAKIIKIHRKLLPAPKGAGLTEFSFDSGFLGYQRRCRIHLLKQEVLAPSLCIKPFSYLKNFDYVVGTTAKTGTDYNVPRCPLTPEEFAGKISKIKNKKNPKIALLFGREGIGLTNNEILQCDFVVTIPTSKNYKTLNISHAAAIIFYELFKTKAEKINEMIVPASKIEKEIILEKIAKILDKLPFATKEKKETQRRVWKRVIGKAMLTKREAFALLGFLRKLNSPDKKVK